MILIPNLPAGLGDIIFIMSGIKKQGLKTIWPVYPHFIDQLQPAYPDITFVEEKLLNLNYQKQSSYIESGARVLPLVWEHNIPGPLVMKGKYDFLNLDWNIWKEGVIYQRNIEKEIQLFNFLNPENASFNLTNGWFFSKWQGQRQITPPNNGLKEIKMGQVPGYSLFDWSYTIQKATSIHTVATAVVYLLELLTLDAKDIKIYLRSPHEKNHDGYGFILTSHNYQFE